MNSLGIDLKIGDKVVVEKEYMSNKKATEKERTFCITADCFGCKTYTNGTAIGGYWETLGEENGHCRIEGYMLEKLIK